MKVHQREIIDRCSGNPLLNDFEKEFISSLNSRDQYYVLSAKQELSLLRTYIKILEYSSGIRNKALGEVEG